MLRKIPDVFGFLRFVLRRWTEDRCPQIAASLTYTTLLALVPVLAIVVAMLSSMPFFEQVMVRLKIFLLLNLVPELAGKIIIEYMEPFARNAARVTGISFSALVVVGIGMMWTVDRSLNTIWRVRRNRPGRERGTSVPGRGETQRHFGPAGGGDRARVCLRFPDRDSQRSSLLVIYA